MAIVLAPAGDPLRDAFAAMAGDHLPADRWEQLAGQICAKARSDSWFSRRSSLWRPPFPPTYPPHPLRRSLHFAAALLLALLLVSALYPPARSMAVELWQNFAERLWKGEVGGVSAEVILVDPAQFTPEQVEQGKAMAEQRPMSVTQVPDLAEADLLLGFAPARLMMTAANLAGVSIGIVPDQEREGEARLGMLVYSIGPQQVMLSTMAFYLKEGDDLREQPAPGLFLPLSTAQEPGAPFTVDLGGSDALCVEYTLRPPVRQMICQWVLEGRMISLVGPADSEQMVKIARLVYMPSEDPPD